MVSCLAVEIRTRRLTKTENPRVLQRYRKKRVQMRLRQEEMVAKQKEPWKKQVQALPLNQRAQRRMRPREEKHWLSIILQADTQKMWRM